MPVVGITSLCMPEFLKTTFYSFYLEGKGSIPAFQPCTNTRMAESLIAKFEVKRALECFTLVQAVILEGFTLRL